MHFVWQDSTITLLALADPSEHNGAPQVSVCWIAATYMKTDITAINTHVTPCHLFHLGADGQHTFDGIIAKPAS